jgi:membrane-associated protease RseP (regulator of RpoE activity)
MSFIIYDIMLLILFAIFASIFLYVKRKNLKREGLLFLYRTKWGIKLIDYIGKKCNKGLKILSYVSIGLGYILMLGMLYLFGKIFWIYIFNQDVVRAIKVPPIMPLIPYIDKVVPFLPSFYFIYWVIILAVIAIPHEFAHGIFAAYKKIKIKTTGFGFFPFFFPVFPLAFVELDEKKMAKKSKFSQMAVLSAGTFANILTAILFFGILWLFFSLAFSPAGVQFDSYSYSIVEVASISLMNGVTLDNPSYEKFVSLAENNSLNNITGNGKNYVGIKGFFADNEEYVQLYDDSPAINSGLNGAITEINEIKINEVEKLKGEILKYSPGEKVVIKTETKEESLEYEIALGENPENKSLPWLGIGFENYEGSGITGKILVALTSFKKPHIYYEPKIGEISMFIYNLLWWIILISISVALVNMLPMGIFDGGRFFYLTVFALTKSERKAKHAFSFLTYLILFSLLLLMIFWFLSFR